MALAYNEAVKFFRNEGCVMRMDIVFLPNKRSLHSPCNISTGILQMDLVIFPWAVNRLMECLYVERAVYLRLFLINHQIFRRKPN